MTNNDSTESLKDLCARVKSILPAQFRDDAWYLIVVCWVVKRHLKIYVHNR